LNWRNRFSIVPQRKGHLSDRLLVVRVLIGELFQSGLSVSSKVVLADPPVFRAGFLSILRRPRVEDWLRRKTGISSSEARAIAKSLGLQPDEQICRLAGNPRAMLGLKAAYARGAEAIIYSTVGCDFSGIKALYEAVLSHIDQCPAIHLSYAYWTQGRRERFCHPKARCLEVRQAQESGTVIKSA
jgi:hypothetical protein